MAGIALWPRVRAVAYSYANFTEQPPSSNRGQVVDRFVRHVGLEPEGAYAWCLAYVQYAGWWGLYDPTSRKSAWPLKRTAGCQDLADWAKAKGVLTDKPEPGDVFLVWYVFRDKQGRVTEERFGHAGFLVDRKADGTWDTLEANTSKPGDTDPKTAREGWGVFSKARVLKPADRFVRWTALL